MIKTVAINSPQKKIVKGIISRKPPKGGMEKREGYKKVWKIILA